MKNSVTFDSVEVGTKLPDRVIALRRVNLLRYCGACSDYTGTHWNERIAQSVGLPNVISHGTLNIAVVTAAVSDWVGDPGAVLGYAVERFSHPVVVPDDDLGGEIEIGGHVEAKLELRQVIVRMKATSRGKQVLGGTRIRLQLP